MSSGPAPCSNKPPAQRARDAQRAVDGVRRAARSRAGTDLHPRGLCFPRAGAGLVSRRRHDHGLPRVVGSPRSGAGRRVGGRRGQRRVPPRSGTPVSGGQRRGVWRRGMGCRAACLSRPGSRAHRGRRRQCGWIARRRDSPACARRRGADAGSAGLGVSRYRAPVAAAVDGRVRGQSLPLRDRCGLDEIPLPGRRPHGRRSVRRSGAGRRSVGSAGRNRRVRSVRPAARRCRGVRRTVARCRGRHRASALSRCGARLSRAGRILRPRRYRGRRDRALVRARFSRPPAFAETHATTSEVYS